ncbi:esterase [Erwinia sp. CPCC 100877]|nr:esterase [Erwinia sp. CPCC 100877]
MKLNTRLQTAQSPVTSSPVVLIHGLFGSLDNLGVLGRSLVKDRTVLQLDLRNHGLSPRSDIMTYPAMAQDVLDTLDACQLDKVTLIGHSMGGKVSMALSALAPGRIDQLVMIDIAPVAYPVRRHDAIFAAVRAVTEQGATSRHDAAAIMREHIEEEGVIQFLLKSFANGDWRFNVSALWDQYDNIVGWEPTPPWPRPALFIRGGNSPYIQAAYQSEIAAQFPLARAHVIAGAGHWVHAEKPQAVLRAIHRFLASD